MAKHIFHFSSHCTPFLLIFREMISTSASLLTTLRQQSEIIVRLLQPPVCISYMACRLILFLLPEHTTFSEVWMLAYPYHCTNAHFLWFNKVKNVKFSSFSPFIESASPLFYRLTRKFLIQNNLQILWLQRPVLRHHSQ